MVMIQEIAVWMLSYLNALPVFSSHFIMLVFLIIICFFHFLLVFARHSFSFSMCFVYLFFVFFLIFLANPFFFHFVFSISSAFFLSVFLVFFFFFYHLLVLWDYSTCLPRKFYQRQPNGVAKRQYIKRAKSLSTVFSLLAR